VDSRHYGDMARQIDPPIDDARLRALAAGSADRCPEDLEAGTLGVAPDEILARERGQGMYAAIVGMIDLPSHSQTAP